MTGRGSTCHSSRCQAGELMALSGFLHVIATANSHSHRALLRLDATHSKLNFARIF